MNKREGFISVVSFLEKMDGLTETLLVSLFNQKGYHSMVLLTLIIIFIKFLRKIILVIKYSGFKVKTCPKEEMGECM